MLDDDMVATAGVSASSGMADLSGTVVAGRYRLATPLGHGAMANVYRAVDNRLDREVAVKLFHPGQEAAVRSRFGAEAQALARLSHPGLVSIFDAGVEGDRPYLVMQLVDGESLRDRLLAGPLTHDDIVLLGARLATALAHVHGNGIVHRDIKPSNIVLDHNGSPHLADFGIALLLDAARMTGSNEIMGTAAYLSPEQILGADVGAAADVYSLGLVLLECMTGELEYPGVSKVESALARLHRSPKMPDDIPPVLGELLSAMTAREPADRPVAGDCAAWFWAVREHSGMTSRAAGLAAASWLARRGKQPGRSRTPSPLFSGWRRFAIAGSGLAMAILASTWLFTSLLPRAMPNNPTLGGAVPPHVTIGVSEPNADVQQQNGGGGPAMHIAIDRTTDGGGANAGTDPSAPVSTTGTGVLEATSTLFGPPLTESLTDEPTSSIELQDSSVDGGPADAPPTTDDSTTDTPPSTDTTDNGVNSSPPSPSSSDETSIGDSSSSSPSAEPRRGIQHGRGTHRSSGVLPTPAP